MDISKKAETFGDRLKKRREELGLSVEEVAQEIAALQKYMLSDLLKNFLLRSPCLMCILGYRSLAPNGMLPISILQNLRYRFRMYKKGFLLSRPSAPHLFQQESVLWCWVFLYSTDLPHL